MKKRVFSWTLVLCLLLSLLPSAALAGELPFRDVAPGDWFFEDVSFVFENGLMNGTSGDRFSPQDLATRGMIVTVLHRCAGAPVAEAAAPFDDAAEESYCAAAVAWAAEEGIVNGYGDGRFGPDDPATREQLAAILFRFAAYLGLDTGGRGELSAFSDGDEASGYARDALSWAVDASILRGTPEGMLLPKGLLTRAMLAAMLRRMTENGLSAEKAVVTFQLNYAGAPEAAVVEVEKGRPVARPEDPTRTGAAFEGWFTAPKGGERYDFDAPVTGDLTLYAQWRVTVVSYGGYTPAPPAPHVVDSRYEEVPAENGVFLNKDLNAGDALTDYAVAYNGDTEKTAFMFYSLRGMTPVKAEMEGKTADDLAALREEGKAMTVPAGEGFQTLPEDLLSLEGDAFDASQREKFYYVYLALADENGVELIKCVHFITPAKGPDAPETYGKNPVGAIVPGGGNTSIYAQSKAFSPYYTDALRENAVAAGIETPRVAVMETTLGKEDALYDDFHYPADGYESVCDTLAERGMEPVYVPLAIDNYEELQNDPYFADLIRSCHVIFFTGGNQAYYARALLNDDGSPSLAAQAIVDVITHGGALAGSSAGAMAMSGTILSGGANYSYQTLYWNTPESLNITDYDASTLSNAGAEHSGNNYLFGGVGFVEPLIGQDVIIDSHVDGRGRIGRLAVALRDAMPTGIAVGLDNTTCMRIDGYTGIGTVHGTSGVYVLDGANAVWGEPGTVGEFTVEGLTVHYLTDGDRFDFAARAVLPADDKQEITDQTDGVFIPENIFGVDQTGTTMLNFAHSTARTVVCPVGNGDVYPFNMGNHYDVTLEKTQDTLCLTNGRLFPRANYFDTYLQSTLTNLRMSVTFSDNPFDPGEGDGFEAESVEKGSKSYEAFVVFSSPISVGYSGNNKYFLDCEVAENDPSLYIQVIGENGEEKLQDRTYTFRIDNETRLRIVLDTESFASGDCILVKTTVFSKKLEHPQADKAFRFDGAEWTEIDVSEIPQPAQPGDPEDPAAFEAESVEKGNNSYDAYVIFSAPIHVGYSGKNKYFLDCEVAENDPSLYIQVIGENGEEKLQDRTYTFRIDNETRLRIVLNTQDFASGDCILVKTTVYSVDEVCPQAEKAFRFDGTEWTEIDVSEIPQPGQPGEPEDPTAFEALSVTSESNGYAVGIEMSHPIHVGYAGNRKWFQDLDDETIDPNDYVEVQDSAGKTKEQDRGYTFRIDNETSLRIVLADDIYFAEGDKVIVKTAVTDTDGTELAEEAVFVLENGVWVKQ